jgi:hypothetical protein
MLLLALLFYGYASGEFFIRKLEKATHDFMASKYICANENPDHDCIITLFCTNKPEFFEMSLL